MQYSKESLGFFTKLKWMLVLLCRNKITLEFTSIGDLEDFKNHIEALIARYKLTHPED
jgi:hypothetical protein